MSTRSTVASVIASAGVLLAGWQAGTAHGQTVAAVTAPTTTTTSTATTRVISAPRFAECVV